MSRRTRRSYFHADCEEFPPDQVAIVESKYGSNENHGRNDGFSTQIENKIRKNTLFFSTRIRCLSQD